VPQFHKQITETLHGDDKAEFILNSAPNNSATSALHYADGQRNPAVGFRPLSQLNLTIASKPRKSAARTIKNEDHQERENTYCGSGEEWSESNVDSLDSNR
jgi:hypothetical protein